MASTDKSEFEDDPLAPVREQLQKMNRIWARDPDPAAGLSRDATLAFASALNNLERRLARGLTVEEVQLMAEIDMLDVEAALQRLVDWSEKHKEQRDDESSPT